LMYDDNVSNKIVGGGSVNFRVYHLYGKKYDYQYSNNTLPAR
jgi:hypothetical protein